MAIDRQGNGLVIVRICLGVFLVAAGVSKLRWLIDTSMLSRLLGEWMQSAAPGSISRWYLEHFAIPGTAVLARLIPLGEISSGLALLIGVWTPIFAFLAFVMALNTDIANGTIFTIGFVTHGYGLLVLGSTLGLTLGGVRLPWSLR